MSIIIRTGEYEDKNWFTVVSQDREARGLTYSEMIGLVTALTLPENREELTSIGEHLPF